MPEYHITRLDQMTQAVNTFAAVETLPDGSTGGAVQVPVGARHIKGIRVCISNSAPVATDSGVVFNVRLGGNGLANGQQDFIVGAQTVNLETTGAGGFVAYSTDPVFIPCDVSVITGNIITISAAMFGVDTGTPEIGVELVFA